MARAKRNKDDEVSTLTIRKKKDGSFQVGHIDIDGSYTQMLATQRDEVYATIEMFMGRDQRRDTVELFTDSSTGIVDLGD